MHDENELIDYSEEDVPAATSAPATTTAIDTNTDETAEKGSYVGINSTGFRDFLLKNELLRAVTDCGFGHPSEGMTYPKTQPAHCYCLYKKTRKCVPYSMAKITFHMDSRSYSFEHSRRFLQTMI